jgi:hypothetical protein
MKEGFTTVAKIIIDDDNIVHIIIKEGANIDTPQVKNIYELIDRMYEGRPPLVLLDGRCDYKLTSDARAYIAENAKSRVASALVTNNIAMKSLFNIFIKINKPATPYRIFTNLDEALSWLKSFIAK